MADKPAGWFNDPYGRFQKRYFDGTKWTAQVETGGEQQIDPLGESTVIPIAIPPTAFPSNGKAAGWIKLLERAPDSQARPRPSMSTALSGLGGLFVVAALFNAIVGNDSSKGKIIAASLVSLVIALAVRLFIKNQTELRSAAVGLGAVGIVGFVVGAAGNDFGDTGPLFLVAGLLIAAWALPGFRGRPLILGTGALFGVVALGAVFSPAACHDDGFGDVCETSTAWFGVPAPFRDLFGNQRFVYLIAGVLLLLLVWWLDRRGFRGTATPLVVTALLATFLGTLKSYSNLDDIGPALFMIAVGAAVCAVGSLGERRATTWLGAFQLASGTSAFVIAVLEPDSQSAITTTLALTAVALIGAPIAVRILRARLNAVRAGD